MNDVRSVTSLLTKLGVPSDYSTSMTITGKHSIIITERNDDGPSPSVSTVIDRVPMCRPVVDSAPNLGVTDRRLDTNLGPEKWRPQKGWYNVIVITSVQDRGLDGSNEPKWSAHHTLKVVWLRNKTQKIKQSTPLTPFTTGVFTGSWKLRGPLRVKDWG